MQFKLEFYFYNKILFPHMNYSILPSFTLSFPRWIHLKTRADKQDLFINITQENGEITTRLREFNRHSWCFNCFAGVFMIFIVSTDMHDISEVRQQFYEILPKDIMLTRRRRGTCHILGTSWIFRMLATYKSKKLLISSNAFNYYIIFFKNE